MQIHIYIQTYVCNHSKKKRGYQLENGEHKLGSGKVAGRAEEKKGTKEML